MSATGFRTPRKLLLVTAAALLAVGGRIEAEEISVGVAANFAEAATEIGALFRVASGHRAVFSFASTGQLYAQIAHGAPFDVFLAADERRPRLAIEAGLAAPESCITYATGRLVLFSRQSGLALDARSLGDERFTRIAIANPLTAPYGAAAVEVLQALGVYERLKSRLVQGSNIAQTYEFVYSGNAELGLVALSQVASHHEGSRWIVPQTLHGPIAQDGVLLKSAAESRAARAFLAFLNSPAAGAVKRKYGYDPGE